RPRKNTGARRARCGAYLAPIGANMPGQSSRSRWLAALLALAGTVAVRTASPPAKAAATSDLVEKYCVTCHNSRLKTAGLQLDGLDVNDVARDAPQWEKVVTKLRTGEMPPAGRPRPDAATYNAVASALENELDAAAAAKPHPGRVPVHRLNRNEYTNA